MSQLWRSNLPPFWTKTMRSDGPSVFALKTLERCGSSVRFVWQVSRTKVPVKVKDGERQSNLQYFLPDFWCFSNLNQNTLPTSSDPPFGTPIWHNFWHVFLALFLAFYLAYSLAFYLANCKSLNMLECQKDWKTKCYKLCQIEYHKRMDKMSRLGAIEIFLLLAFYLATGAHMGFGLRN